MDNLTKYKPSARKVVRYLGGATALEEYYRTILSGYSVRPVSKNTINGWVRNNSVPFQYIPGLYLIGKIIGSPLTVEQMIEPIPVEKKKGRK